MKADHFAVLADQGVFPEEADPGTPPEELEQCFSWWKEMHKERQEGFSGGQVLTSIFIAQWLHLYGITPFDIELKAIRIIEDAYQEVMNGRHSKTSNHS